MHSSSPSPSPLLLVVVVGMAKHHPDLIQCRKQPGIAIGRLCAKCDGKCVICDSYVRPCTVVRVCDECNYGTYEGRCVICGGKGLSEAFYCTECTHWRRTETDAPKIVNLGSAKTDLFYERKYHTPHTTTPLDSHHLTPPHSVSVAVQPPPSPPPSSAHSTPPLHRCLCVCRKFNFKKK